MKIRLRAICMVLISALIAMMSASALAGGWSGTQVIRNLNYTNNKTVVVVGLYGPWNNPTACESDKAVLLDPNVSQESYDQVFAMLLGAHLTGREINFFLSGCKLLGSQTVPVIKNVNIF